MPEHVWCWDASDEICQRNRTSFFPVAGRSYFLQVSRICLSLMRVKASLGGTFRGSTFRFLLLPCRGVDGKGRPGSRLLWPAARTGTCVLVASKPILPRLVAAGGLLVRQSSRWELTNLSGSIAPQLGQRTCPRGRSILLPVPNDGKPRACSASECLRAKSGAYRRKIQLLQQREREVQVPCTWLVLL